MSEESTKTLSLQIHLREGTPERISGKELREGTPGRISGKDLREGTPGRIFGKELREGTPGRIFGKELQEGAFRKVLRATDDMTEINIIQCPLQQAAAKIAETAAKAGCGDELFIVHDKNVAGIVDRLALKAKGTLAIDATEEKKSFETVMDIARWLMELEADRHAFVLGIGGGITTDMVGFAASTYKRGVKFAFLPTTLLSQVDAAIGGKNGVNLDSYKNMIGIIRQPEATVICPEVLETLPYEQIVSGAAELLKTFIIDNSGDNYAKAVAILGAINKAEDKALVLKEYAPQLQELIAAAAQVKAGIAGRDPNEHGERKFLNLGHTFAHAIEKKSEEKIGHGAAVSMGMILAAQLADALGLTELNQDALRKDASGALTIDPDCILALKLEKDFKACGMPTECPYSMSEMGAAMKKDKKAEGSIVHFVVPTAVGHVQIEDLTVEEVVRILG